MDASVLVSVMGVLTVVAIYFWWARKPAAGKSEVKS
jgi:hypothetical protein